MHVYEDYKFHILILYSVDDDAQLRAKVDEAMAVYDEYVKTNQGPADGEGAAKEEKTEEKA